MLARLTVAALAAITLASASAAAAVSTQPANGSTSAQQAALVPADGAGPIPDRLSAPSLFELPAKLTRFYLYEHMQGLGLAGPERFRRCRSAREQP